MPNHLISPSEFSKSNFESLLKELRAVREHRQNELEYADLRKSAKETADKAQQDFASTETLPAALEGFKLAAQDYQRAKDLDSAEVANKQIELARGRIRHLPEVNRLLNFTETLLSELESRQAKGALPNDVKQPMLVTGELLLATAASLYPEARQIQIARDRLAKFKPTLQAGDSASIPNLPAPSDHLETLSGRLNQVERRVTILIWLVVTFLLFACVTNAAILSLEARPLLAAAQTDTATLFATLVEASATPLPLPTDTEIATATVEPMATLVIPASNTPPATDTPIIPDTPLPTETPTLLASPTSSVRCTRVLFRIDNPAGLRKSPYTLSDNVIDQTKESFAAIYVAKIANTSYFKVSTNWYGEGYILVEPPPGCEVPTIERVPTVAPETTP